MLKPKDFLQKVDFFHLNILYIYLNKCQLDMCDLKYLDKKNAHNILKPHMYE